MPGETTSQTITIILSEGLQELLRPGKRGPVVYPMGRRASIKDIVESLGVSHTEIGAIRVEDRDLDFGFIPAPGQAVRVTGIEAPFEVTSPSLLRPEPIPAVRFVVDVNVGRLAALLRLTGFDAAYENGLSDSEIAELAHRDQRIVLTKDRALLKRSKIDYGRLVRATYPDDQLLETLQFFGLSGPFDFFSRCLRCNRKLQPIAKADILPRLEPKTKKYFNTFKTCPRCDRIYWRGSHCDAMEARLKAAGFKDSF